MYKQAPQAPPRPAGTIQHPKQARTTTVPKPVGLDPIMLLQERENRYPKMEFTQKVPDDDKFFDNLRA